MLPSQLYYQIHLLAFTHFSFLNSVSSCFPLGAINSLKKRYKTVTRTLSKGTNVFTLDTNMYHLGVNKVPLSFCTLRYHPSDRFLPFFPECINLGSPVACSLKVKEKSFLTVISCLKVSTYVKKLPTCRNKAYCNT